MNLVKTLTEYFFDKNGKLRLESPTDKELNKIGDYFKTVLEKNLDVEDYQDNFIKYSVEQEISKLNKKNQLLANNRKEEIKNLTKKLINKLTSKTRRKIKIFKKYLLYKKKKK